MSLELGQSNGSRTERSEVALPFIAAKDATHGESLAATKVLERPARQPKIEREEVGLVAISRDQSLPHDIPEVPRSPRHSSLGT